MLRTKSQFYCGEYLDSTTLRDLKQYHFAELFKGSVVTPPLVPILNQEATHFASRDMSTLSGPRTS